MMTITFPRSSAKPATMTSHFVGRLNGKGKAPFDSLNLSSSVGDSSEIVSSNMDKVRRRLGLPDRVIELEQVHGHDVVIDREVGVQKPRADSLILTQPKIAAHLFGADCPLLFVTHRREDLGALVHAGWKGLASGVIRETFARLKEWEASGWEVSIAPSIGICCFEVGEEVIEAMSPLPHRVRREPKRPRPHLDLKGVAQDLLLEEGVPQDSIYTHPHCTRCRRDLYFSYRGDGPLTGRNSGFLWIR